MNRVYTFLTGLVLLLIGAAPFAASGASDLIIDALEWVPPEIFPGATVTIRAVVLNVGETDIDDRFYVRFTVDGHQIAAVPVHFGLDSGERKDVVATWVAEEGDHTVSVEADRPFEHVDEANERNNEATLEVFVPLRDHLMAQFEGLRVIVAGFEDISNSGFVNLGEGVADKLNERLSSSGIRLLDRGEFEAVMQERALNPMRFEDVSVAGSLLGADMVVIGTIEHVGLQQASLSFGVVRLSGGSADVKLNANVISAQTGEHLGTLCAEGREDGMSGFSVDIGSIAALGGGSDTCAGGFRTDRDWYYTGQVVSVGYQNPGPPQWYSVEIHSLTGTFIRWLGWQYVPTGACDVWHWDQRDSVGIELPPGIYNAKLWNGVAFSDTATIQIRPGIGVSIPLFDEILVGSEPFEATVVGAAVNHAADQLASSIISLLGEVADEPPVPGMEANDVMLGARAAVEAPRRPAAQVAAILPDERIAINIGHASGLALGDVVEVCEIQNLVVDPLSLEILDYEVVRVKGQAVVIEVRDRVSYVIQLTEFEPAIGDIVCSVAP